MLGGEGVSNENELLEPLATEAGQQAIARAINNLGSLENAVRAERAAATATQKADEARNSAEDASDYATEARNWATKTDGYVAQETITIPPEQEGDDPTTETIDLYSARYYAALAQDAYNNLQFDTEPTENSTALVSSGAIYTALSGKADKSDTYTKTEVDTALGNVQSTLTFDSTPTANSNNPVTSGGIYTALQNVNIDIDDEITEDSDNPVTSAAIYEALQNLPSGSEISGDVIYDVLSLPDYVNSQDLLSGYTPTTTIREVTVSKDGVARIWGDCATTGYTILIYVNGIMVGRYSSYARITIDKHIIVKSGDIIGIKVDGGSNWRNVSITLYPFVPKILSEQMYSNVLYENSSGVNSGTITLNDDISNYDFLEFKKITNPDKYYGFISVEEFKQRTSNDRYVSHGYGANYIAMYYIGEREIGINGSSNEKLVKIIGHKMARGGYSGIVSDARMTVKSGTLTWTSSINANQTISKDVVFDSPMPDTNYTVLFSLASGIAGHNKSIPRVNQSYKSTSGFTMKMWVDTQIPCTSNDPYVLDWIAIRPNSYTREGMVEDVLFSNTNGVNSGTINLSGNISDYDLIIFETNRGGQNSLNQNRNIFTASSLQELTGTTNLGNCILLTGYDNDYLKLTYINNNTLNIYESVSLKLLKITGIKFGRYVSGVAVDNTITSSGTGVPTTSAVYQALQNIPSGGGSSITVDSTITQGGTNPVEGGAIYTALGNKADQSTTYTKTEVDTALSGKQGTLTFDTTPTQNSTNPVTSGGVYTALQNLPTGTGDVTTNTDQNITGTKTFVGSKKVAFKQSATNDKLGFTLFGNTGTERGYLEFNPQNTIDGVAGLMTLGNYATSAGALTHVGFRRYSNISGASGAYNLLTPMVADARTPFSLTTSYQNFYLPLGFTDGTTTVRTAKTGVVDLSPIIQNIIASANNVSNANGVSY